MDFNIDVKRWIVHDLAFSIIVIISQYSFVCCWFFFCRYCSWLISLYFIYKCKSFKSAKSAKKHSTQQLIWYGIGMLKIYPNWTVINLYVLYVFTHISRERQPVRRYFLICSTHAGMLNNSIAKNNIYNIYVYTYVFIHQQ